MIEKCCEEMQRGLNIESAKLVYTKAAIEIAGGGVEAIKKDRTTVVVTNIIEDLPDIVAFLQNETDLTRSFMQNYQIGLKSLHH